MSHPRRVLGSPRLRLPSDDFQSLGEIGHIWGTRLIEMFWQGSVAFRGFERISFVNLVTSRRPGESLPLTIVRDGAEMELDVTLKTSQKLVPRLDVSCEAPCISGSLVDAAMEWLNERVGCSLAQGVDASPRYIVVGGLVFVPLSVPFMMHHFGCNRTHFPANEMRPRANQKCARAQVLTAVGAHDEAEGASGRGRYGGCCAGESAGGRHQLRVRINLSRSPPLVFCGQQPSRGARSRGV